MLCPPKADAPLSDDMQPPPGTLSEKSFADMLGSSLYIYRLFLICKIDEEIIYNYLDTVTG
jgi:hypothetical protein